MTKKCPTVIKYCIILPLERRVFPTFSRNYERPTTEPTDRPTGQPPDRPTNQPTDGHECSREVILKPRHMKKKTT